MSKMSEGSTTEVYEAVNILGSVGFAGALGLFFGFLFGVIHSIDDVEGPMREIHRVLGLRDLLSVQTSRIPREALLESVTGTGLISFIEESHGVCRFQKTP